jgi:hypothetical protein
MVLTDIALVHVQNPISRINIFGSGNTIDEALVNLHNHSDYSSQCPAPQYFVMGIIDGKSNLIPYTPKMSLQGIENITYMAKTTLQRDILPGLLSPAATAKDDEYLLHGFTFERPAGHIEKGGFLTPD